MQRLRPDADRGNGVPPALGQGSRCATGKTAVSCRAVSDAAESAIAVPLSAQPERYGAAVVVGFHQFDQLQQEQISLVGW